MVLDIDLPALGGGGSRFVPFKQIPNFPLKVSPCQLPTPPGSVSGAPVVLEPGVEGTQSALSHLSQPLTRRVVGTHGARARDPPELVVPSGVDVLVRVGFLGGNVEPTVPEFLREACR